MDYKKKYKEALERAKIELNADTTQGTKNVLMTVFPELKESEDEKIRKELIEHCKNQTKVYIDTGNECPQIQSWIAWLEKQGNNNQNWKPSKGQINVLEHFVRGIGESGYASPYDENTKLLYSLLNDLCKLEKQDEQKPILDFKAKDWCVSKVDGQIHDMTYNPADKIKPKFKVGDWIIFNGFIIHIDKVVDGYYITTTFGGIPNSYDWDIDNVARLWTIQDAKDGDVLACGDKVTDCPFIFHNLTKESNPRSYCGINMLQHFQDNDENGGFWCRSNEVRPATKEQRDLLFQKIKEAGYEWDAKNKELKKIK